MWVYFLNKARSFFGMLVSYRRILLTAVVMLFCFSAFPVGAATAPKITDVRILIDVSGSMKKNDPQNLRRSALRLLVGLLPKNTRAGVWTFGKYVNMQVPLGQVNEGWKKQAMAKTEGIHSRGLFTNIEDALIRATDDWKKPSDQYGRHVVLLTDGMVDISKDSAKNKASQERVLATLLPQIQQQGGMIHTIALSARADESLMQQLAEYSGGWFAQVDDADALQRVFLKIFEKLGKPDTLPLKDNRFTVDNSIDEMTLLVFRSKEGKTSQLKMPSGSLFDRDSAPANAKWHRDEGYDLVTISKPEAGEWHIIADVDPDNRVMIVTDLKMDVAALPNTVLQGEELLLKASFSEQGKLIVRKEFLELVQVAAEYPDSEGEMSEPAPLMDDASADDDVAGDGVFSFELDDVLPLGRAEIIVHAEGKTFNREYRHLFEIVSPMTVATQVDKKNENLTQITLSTSQNLLDVNNALINAKLKASGTDDSQAVDFIPSGDGIWQASIDRSLFSGLQTLQVNVNARTHTGRAVRVDLAPIELEGSLAPVVAEAEAISESSTVEDVIVDEVPAAVEDVMDWTQVAIYLGIGNGVLIALAGGAFFFIRRRKKGDDELDLLNMEGSTA